MGLKVKLTRSAAGSDFQQKATVSALGLKKFGDERLLKDTPAIRGMIFKVQHLVSHEVVKEEPKKAARKKTRAIRVRDAARARAAQGAK
jgi:large subunit ribosomal protein L30